MSNKERDDQIRVYRGAIPWSVAEYDWVIAAFDQRRPKNVNLPLPPEFAEYKEEFKAAKGEDLENFKDMILFSDIFHKRYPKKLEYDAHSYRFNQINDFLITHEDKLFQLKLIYVKEGKKHVDPRLMEALCTMLYDEEAFDESGEWTGNTFSFKDAVAQTRPKNARKTGNKRPTEEQAFNGLVPWSAAEFRWIIQQYGLHRLKDKENRDLQDKYFPIKLQMMRQLGSRLGNFDAMMVLNEIFHERYSNRLEAMAHFFRYRSIFEFVDEYKDQLKKEGFVHIVNGNVEMESELIESLCVLPYVRDAEKTDKKHGFSYKEVVAKAKALRDSRLN